MEKEFYIGFTLDGKERLLEKKYDDFAESTISYFKDVETKEIFDYFDIDIKTLKKADSILKDIKNKSKRKVRKAYKIDRSKILKIKYLIAFDIYDYKKNDRFKNEEHLIEENILFNIDCPGETVEKVDDGSIILKYKAWPFYGHFTKNSRDVNEYFKKISDEESLTKRKILEIDYKRRNERRQ